MNNFIANLFELWGAGYLGDFSKYMYKANLYGEVAIWLLVVPLIVFFLYYKVFDHIKLAKVPIWFVILLLVSLLVSLIGYNIADSGIADYLMEHKIKSTKIMPVDYFWFSFIVFIYTAVLSFFYSCLLKLGASKTRRIPF